MSKTPENTPPPKNPPPPRRPPTKPPNKAAGHIRPARQSPQDGAAPVAHVADGPGPNVPGELLSPGRNGRAGGAPGAATFTPPNTRVPLRFDEGEHRLVGRVRPVKRPGLSWLPSLMLPSLLLLAAIDNCAWMQWWV